MTPPTSPLTEGPKDVHVRVEVDLTNGDFEVSCKDLTVAERVFKEFESLAKSIGPKVTHGTPVSDWDKRNKVWSVRP